MGNKQKMSSKRRRPSTTNDRGNAPSKRIKFTLDSQHIQLPGIENTGSVLVMGAGDVGQLGLGVDISEKSRPFVVPLQQEIVDVCAGAMHTVCLTKDGKVITFGCNDEGALGRKTADDDAEYNPGHVLLPEPVRQITAGDSHTAALLHSGRVFAWGNFRDSHGGMGLRVGGVGERLPYELTGALVDGDGGAPLVIVKIASGADHIVMLTRHGAVYTCGCPEQGQLGRTTERSSCRTARNTRGIDQLTKFLTPSPISLKPSLRIIFDDIWTGTYTSFVRASHSASGTSLTSPEIYVFGLNNYHQLGLATPLPQFLPKRSDALTALKPAQIVSGQHHTIVRDQDGKIFTLGRKEYGRLGLGETCEDAVNPQQVDVGTTENIVWVSCGSVTSFAVTGNGQLFAWGMGGGGQLGTGHEDDCATPTLLLGKQLAGRRVLRVSGGGQHTVIIAADATEQVQVQVQETADDQVSESKGGGGRKVAAKRGKRVNNRPARVKSARNSSKAVVDGMEEEDDVQGPLED